MKGAETERESWAERRQTPPPAAFFVALMTHREGYCERLEEDLRQRLGPLQHRSELYPFSPYSNYYDREMGGAGWKYFLSFRQPLGMDQLGKVKCLTEKLEWESFASSNSPTELAGYRRRVNLDPGYVSAWSVVLATVKNRAHRLYLGNGIFCEVTLIFRDGSFQGLPWTYPDYLSGPTLAFFNRVRRHHLQ